MKKKVALIIGVRLGNIGGSTAVELAKRGYEVVAVSRTEENLKAVAALHPQISYRAGSMTDPEFVIDLAEWVMKRYGQIDVAMYSAGGFIHDVPFLEQSVEQLREMIDGHVVGPFLTAQAALPDMLNRGEGLIINISSLAGIPEFMLSGRVTYNVAKTAMNALSHSISIEDGVAGKVHAISICPGLVDTPMTENFLEQNPEWKGSGLTGEEAGQLIAEFVEAGKFPDDIYLMTKANGICSYQLPEPVGLN